MAACPEAPRTGYEYHRTCRVPCGAPQVLSYKRLDLLNATLRSILTHLEQVETDVSYEVVWVDNGSDEAQRQALHRELRIEKALLLGTNYGMAYGFNSLFFRLCAAPYILTLEEDWEWQGASSGAGRTALRDAMTVLRHDVKLSGVFLRPDTLDQFLTHSEWRRAGGGELPVRVAAVSATWRRSFTAHRSDTARYSHV